MKQITALLFALAVTNASADPLEDKLTAYRDCTESAMPLLDDRVSDVETIATGLHAQCSAQFDAIYQEKPGLSRTEWLRIVRPHVVQSLLKYRVMQNKAPTTKAKPTS